MDVALYIPLCHRVALIMQMLADAQAEGHLHPAVLQINRG